MERNKTERDYEREIYDEVDRETDREDEHDTEAERRAGPSVMHEVDPEPPRDRNGAIYGETEIDPGRFDRKRDHHAEDDQHV